MTKVGVAVIVLSLTASPLFAFDLGVVKEGFSKIKELDSDGDNQINLTEFKDAGGKAKYFNKADSDKDGFISIKDAKKQLKRFY